MTELRADGEAASAQLWTSPGSVDTGLRGSCRGFETSLELGGAQIAERRMPAIPVVPGFDVLEDRGSGLTPPTVFRPLEEFLLQGGEETLGDRVDRKSVV